MLNFFFSLLTSIPGLAGKFIDLQAQKVNVTLEGFKAAGVFDLQAYQSWLTAQVEINRMKVAQNSWWGARVIILTVGGAAALHMSAIFLDSMPFWLHDIGSWGIPKPPAPYDAYERDIVMSFFLVTPVMPVLSAVSAWMAKR